MLDGTITAGAADGLREKTFFRGGSHPGCHYCALRNVVLARASLVLSLPRMDPLLKLLHENAALTPGQLAAMLNTAERDVAAQIKRYESEHVILGYRAVLNEDKLARDIVRALIEVKITPERGGGFDRLAERIAKYSEVQSCYLMSGGYDLLVIVEGNSLREVATFVSEKLATIQGVLSTATHFMLRAYKEQGILMKREPTEERLAVTP
jgi:DNA-binding Lrp family transcriptional regulator